MAYNDPADKAMIRLEARRFATRCDGNEGLIQRADSLREIARLASLPIPFRISSEFEARDAQRRLVLAAEERAKELIVAHIDALVKADEARRQGLKNRMTDEWANLTGVLGHLRHWAAMKLAAADPFRSDADA